MNIEINDLSKVYRGGVQALNAIDMTIPGGMFGLLGPHQGIPTLSATILTPVGGYMASGFFGDNQQLIVNATAMQGVESLLLLLGISLLVMIVLWQLMKWEQAQQ